MTTGSSPLARGESDQRQAGPRRMGLIPARAGRISRSRARSRPQWAHPRSRGANYETKGGGRWWPGSSPLARGESPRDRVYVTVPRLIPARAGRIQQRTQRHQPSTAHPRSRGANMCSSGTLSLCRGSSPLARGESVTDNAGAGVFRLIPARAGRISIDTRADTKPTAHPRSRGANFPEAAVDMIPAGSSPLARGECHLRCRGRPSGGLIPARAGRITVSTAARNVHPAHPRSRGANLILDLGDVCGTGSSPLARGE